LFNFGVLDGTAVTLVMSCFLGARIRTRSRIRSDGGAPPLLCRACAGGCVRSGRFDIFFVLPREAERSVAPSETGRVVPGNEVKLIIENVVDVVELGVGWHLHARQRGQEEHGCKPKGADHRFQLFPRGLISSFLPNSIF
jgi:hypothetical protein